MDGAQLHFPIYSTGRRPYSLSLLWRVLRLTPRISAARVLFCPVASRVRRISRRSASYTVDPTRTWTCWRQKRDDVRRSRCAEVGWEVADIERCAVGAEDNGTLNSVAEFAGIARPVVGHHADQASTERHRRHGDCASGVISAIMASAMAGRSSRWSRSGGMVR